MNSELFILNYRSNKHWGALLKKEDVEKLPKSRTKERLINMFRYNIFNLDSEIRKAIDDYLVDSDDKNLLTVETEQEKKVIALKALSETNQADYYEMKNVMFGTEPVYCSDKDLLIMHLASKLFKLDYLSFDECFERRTPVGTTKVNRMFCAPDRKNI